MAGTVTSVIRKIIGFIFLIFALFCILGASYSILSPLGDSVGITDIFMTVFGAAFAWLSFFLRGVILGITKEQRKEACIKSKEKREQIKELKKVALDKAKEQKEQRKQERARLKEKKEQAKSFIKEANSLHSNILLCKHAVGLPLAHGVPCVVIFSDEEINITGSGNEFRLSCGKITNMQIKTDVDIQKAYVSSAGGAVAGAMLFGALGALIGGQAKEITSTTVEYYIIITYYNNGNLEYLSFQTDHHYKAKKLIEKVTGKFSGQQPPIDL